MIAWYQGHLVLIEGTGVSLLLALSVQIPMSAGVFSLAGPGFYAVGGYCAAIVSIHLGVGMWTALVISALVSAVAAAGLWRLIGTLTGLYLGMVTFAFDLIVGVVATNGGSFTGGPTGLFGVVSNIQPYDVLFVVVVVCVAAAWCSSSSLGPRLLAVRSDPQLAMSVGIPVNRYRATTFVCGAVLGACGGSLQVLLRSTISPSDIGFSLVLLALTIVIIGGVSSWIGAVIGSVLFTWLPALLSGVSSWSDVIYSVLVAVFAICSPDGIYGGILTVIRRVRRRRGYAYVVPSEQVGMARHVGR